MSNWFRRHWFPLTLFVASTAIAVFLFQAARDTKSLRINLLSYSDVVRVDASVASDVTVSYRGSPVSGLTLARLRITNTGRSPIRPDDYQRPVAIAFPSGSAILDCHIVEEDPPGIAASVQCAVNTATFGGELLNASDSITAEVLLVDDGLVEAGGALPIVVSGRVVGVSEIDVADGPPPEPRGRSLTLNLAVVFATLVAAASAVRTLLRTDKFMRSIAESQPGKPQ